METKNLKLKILSLLFALLLFLPVTFIVGCSNDKASVLSGIGVNSDEPKIRVYNTSTKTTTEMDLEKYVAGVVAGEVYNTWEEEALKTQCILARTFALKFAQSNPEIYKEKGISTSITDAQSYDESTINDRILQAVKDTRGKVITSNGELIDAYFHSNSGGKTATTKTGFNNLDQEPSYIKSVISPENKQNSKNYSWTATFTKSEVLNALSKMGVSVATLSSASLGQVSESGHYLTLFLGGKEVSATTLRTNLSTTKMKSTKLTSIKVDGNNIVMTGLGYGHGVGVSQWGMQILAQSGKTYVDILNYYFNNISIKTIY